MKLSITILSEETARFPADAKPIGLTAASFGLALVYPLLACGLFCLLPLLVSLRTDHSKPALKIATFAQSMFKTAWKFKDYSVLDRPSNNSGALFLDNPYLSKKEQLRHISLFLRLPQK